MHSLLSCTPKERTACRGCLGTTNLYERFLKDKEFNDNQQQLYDILHKNGHTYYIDSFESDNPPSQISELDLHDPQSPSVFTQSSSIPSSSFCRTTENFNSNMKNKNEKREACVISPKQGAYKNVSKDISKEGNQSPRKIPNSSVTTEISQLFETFNRQPLNPVTRKEDLNTKKLLASCQKKLREKEISNEKVLFANAKGENCLKDTETGGKGRAKLFTCPSMSETKKFFSPRKLKSKSPLRHFKEKPVELRVIYENGPAERDSNRYHHHERGDGPENDFRNNQNSSETEIINLSTRHPNPQAGDCQNTDIKSREQVTEEKHLSWAETFQQTSSRSNSQALKRSARVKNLNQLLLMATKEAQEPSVQCVEESKVQYHRDMGKSSVKGDLSFAKQFHKAYNANKNKASKKLSENNNIESPLSLGDPLESEKDLYHAIFVNENKVQNDKYMLCSRFDKGLAKQRAEILKKAWSNPSKYCDPAEKQMVEENRNFTQDEQMRHPNIRKFCSKETPTRSNECSFTSIDSIEENFNLKNSKTSTMHTKSSDKEKAAYLQSISVSERSLKSPIKVEDIKNNKTFEISFGEYLELKALRPVIDKVQSICLQNIEDTVKILVDLGVLSQHVRASVTDKNQRNHN